MEQLNCITETEKLFIEFLFIKNRIDENLYRIEKEVINTIDKIKLKDTVEECTIHFEQLGTYLSLIDRASIMYHIDISDRLRKFIDDFQRIDHEYTRTKLWYLIRSGKYYL